MKRRNKDLSYIAIITLALVCMIPFVYLSQYVHPVNDDFLFALKHMGVTWWQSVIDSYLTWSGRYFATAISSVNPYAFSSSPLPVLRSYSALVALLVFLIPMFSCRLLLGKQIGAIKSVSLGSLLVITYMSLCPSVSQLMYWFSSYTAYTVNGLMTILFFSMLPRKSPLIVALQAILAFLIPGGNEVTAVLFVLSLSYLAYIYRSRRIWVLLSISLLAIAIVVMSPGNSIRMVHQLSAHPYLWTVTVSCLQTCSWFVLWLPSLLLASLVYVPLFGLKLSRLKVFDTSFTTFLAFSITALFLSHIPVTYGLSSVVIDRTANCLLLFFIAFYFWGLNILLRRYGHHIVNIGKMLTNTDLRKILLPCALYCFIFMLPLNINSPIVTAISDIVTGKASAYSQIHESRLEIARKHSENGDKTPCRLPGLGLTSRTLFVKELEENPNDEFATTYRKIYNLDCQVYVPSGELYFEYNFDALKNLGKSMR